MADQWVAPDTQAAPATAPTTAPATASAAAPPTGPGAPPATGVPPLRPLTIPDILDGALRTWKAAPATMVALAAAFVVPTQVLLGFLTRKATEDVDIGGSFADAVASSGPEDVETGVGGDLFFLALLVEGLALAFVTVAVARVVTGWYTGHRLAFGGALTGSLRRAWPVVVAWVLVHLVEGLFAIALVIPLIVPMTWFAVVSPVIGCEPGGPIRAMRRSYRLCRRRFGAVLGLCILTAIVDLALGGALGALGGLYLELDLPAGWLVNTAVSVASLLVTVPFVAAASTLLYLDLRVRTEGLDIELAAARQFGPMA